MAVCINLDVPREFRQNITSICYRDAVIKFVGARDANSAVYSVRRMPKWVDVA